MPTIPIGVAMAGTEETKLSPELPMSTPRIDRIAITILIMHKKKLYPYRMDSIAQINQGENHSA
jgi:hypothetical protein